MAVSVIWESMLGARMMRAIVYWCLFWRLPIIGNSHVAVSIDVAIAKSIGIAVGIGIGMGKDKGMGIGIVGIGIGIAIDIHIHILKYGSFYRWGLL